MIDYDPTVAIDRDPRYSGQVQAAHSDDELPFTDERDELAMMLDLQRHYARVAARTDKLYAVRESYLQVPAAYLVTIASDLKHERFEGNTLYPNQISTVIDGVTVLAVMSDEDYARLFAR